MPYDDQSNYYDNQNDNSSQNLTQTQQTQADAKKGGYDPNNPNNNLYGDREATNPFFVFTFIKEFLEYFKNLANRIVEKKNYKDGIKSGEAYREKKEAKKAEKEKKKNKREAKKAERSQNGDRQEDITSPSPEFSMFKGKPTTKTPGRTEEGKREAAKQAREQAERQAANQAGQRRQGKTGPTRKINKPSGK